MLMILFVVLLWCVLSLSINYEITYVDPQDCAKDQFFQYSSLSCVKCGSGQEQSQEQSQGFRSCTCKTGYKTVLNNSGPSEEIQCVKCGGSLNETNSLDGSFCIRCQNDSTGGFDENTGTCFDCPENSFARDRDANGARLSMRQCVTCTEDTTLSGAEEKACRRYHSSFLLANNATVRQECVNGEKNSGFTVVGGICFQDSDLIEEKNNLYKVTYVDEDKPIDSSYYERNLRAAEALCRKYSNFKACQLFGNLCVLQDYTGEVCELYKTLVRTPEKKENLVNDNSDWPAYMPWLFYDKKNAGEAPDILDKKEITKTFERNEDIEFLLVVYTLNGSFVGYENGLDSIQICKERPSKMASASKFATTYKSSCSVPIDDLKNMPMFLYDMFIDLGDKIYPVPVLMENYISGNEKVNENSDRTKWQLTRRFFVVDNKIGIRPESKELEFIRYSSKIEVNIRLRSSDGEIYPPMLRIRYEPLEVKDKAKSSIEMSFAVTYEMDLTKIKKDTEVCY